MPSWKETSPAVSESRETWACDVTDGDSSKRNGLDSNPTFRLRVFRKQVQSPTSRISVLLPGCWRFIWPVFLSVRVRLIFIFPPSHCRPHAFSRSSYLPRHSSFVPTRSPLYLSLTLSPLSPLPLSSSCPSLYRLIPLCPSSFPPLRLFFPSLPTPHPFVHMTLQSMKTHDFLVITIKLCLPFIHATLQ